MTLSLRDIIEIADLPSDPADIIPLISNADGTFLFQEGETWDFKETWPFSYSDEYFGGIARLVCAFANTYGGFIVFGVDDKSRKGGRTRTSPNLDRFEQAFTQLTGKRPRLSLRRYTSGVLGDVDILLVHRKSAIDLPFRFLRAIGKYKPDIIWVRSSSEVRQADSDDIPALYISSYDAGEVVRAPLGQLPPSPANVREFVGRMQTVDRIFSWLISEEEPRSFLFGKGGSGKSTVAYEVFKHLRTEGGIFRLGGENILENVIFISGKQEYLNVETRKSERFIGNDFHDEKSLYLSILILAGADIQDDIHIDQIKDALKTLVNDRSCFIVIDDIDTLTTAGHEAGMDFLHGILWRAKKRSKVLYTLRNRPSHSLKTSIEVSGLSGDQYLDFVEVCARQFGVPVPDAKFLNGALMAVSEGRPLVIESIVALRRHTGNFDSALALFEKGSGDDVRSYVFEREWSALDASDRGREILALLALYEKPIAFSDLCTISRLDPSKVRDAIASVQEMFLICDNDSAETTYSLGELTKAFIKQASTFLDLYQTIKVRVENFKKSFYPNSPEINRVQERLNRSTYDLRRGDANAITDLWKEMDSISIQPTMSEDPRFLSIRGFVALLQRPPLLDRARIDFQAAFDFKFSPDIEYVQMWFEAERQSDMGDTNTKRIVDLVNQSRGYNKSDRVILRFRRACYLYSMAKTLSYTEPQNSLSRFVEALSLHLACYKELTHIKSSLIRRSAEYTRNTAFALAQLAGKLDQMETVVKDITGLPSSQGLFLDPIAEPLGYIVQTEMRSCSESKSGLQRLLNRLDALLKVASDTSLWCSEELRRSSIEQLRVDRGKIKTMVARL